MAATQLYVRFRTAAKEHTCDKCGQPIEPGTEYMRSGELDEEGGFSEVKLHNPTDGCPKTRDRPERTRRPNLPQQGWERD